MQEYELYSYQNKWVMDNIYRAVESIAHKVTNTGSVERRIILRVGRYLSQCEQNINHKRYILRLIHREVADALNRNRKELAEHIEDLTSNDDEGQAVAYEPVDVLADINSGKLELKETITLLAKGDRRKNLILNAWADGYTDDTELSHILADALTGQATGHLSYIKRFRTTCRTELTAQAI